MNQSRAITTLFISSIGWGLTWLPIKWLGDRGMDGLLMVFIAFTSAGIVLSPLIYLQYKAWIGRFKYLVLIALVGGLANLTFQVSIYHGDVVRVMILFYLLPVWSVLGGWYFLKETPDRVRIAAVFISLTGAVLILKVDLDTFSGFSFVDLLAIVAGFAFAMNNLLFRATSNEPLAAKVGAMFIGGALLMGGYLLWHPVTASLSDSSTLFYTALYGFGWLTLITFGTQWGVTQLPAARSALIMVMELVGAVVSYSIIMGSGLDAVEIAGGLLVVTAAVMEAWREPEPVKVSL